MCVCVCVCVDAYPHMHACMWWWWERRCLERCVGGRGGRITCEDTIHCAGYVSHAKVALQELTPPATQPEAPLSPFDPAGPMSASRSFPEHAPTAEEVATPVIIRDSDGVTCTDGDGVDRG